MNYKQQEYEPFTAARPYDLETPTVYSSPVTSVILQEPSFTQVGSVIESVPTAVSHHSSSIVHDSSNLIEDILSPALRTTAYTTKTISPEISTYPAVIPIGQPLYPSVAKSSETYDNQPSIVKTSNPSLSYQTNERIPVNQYTASYPLTYTATRIWASGMRYKY
uniref:Uncharacterized protein n=1 Tax=Glossina austeni TaxID=7395 RepID=A0A1A9UJ49_GLOAU